MDQTLKSFIIPGHSYYWVSRKHLQVIVIIRAGWKIGKLFCENIRNVEVISILQVDLFVQKFVCSFYANQVQIFLFAGNHNFPPAIQFFCKWNISMMIFK